MRGSVATIGVIGLALGLSGSAFAISPYFQESFTAPGFLGGWGGGAPVDNPGTGGVDGANDGYLRITRATPGQLGARSTSAVYVDNYIAAGVTGMSLFLNDVGADESLSIHVAIGNTLNFWEYNTGFAPPENAWGKFFVDFTDPSKWTAIGFAPTTFAEALMSTDRILIRHDAEPPSPAGTNPPLIAGSFGVDNILFVPSPNSALVFAGGLLVAGRRRRY